MNTPNLSYSRPFRQKQIPSNWIVASLVVLAAGWLMRPRHSPSPADEMPRESARQRREAGSRSDREKEMTLDEMARFAEGLSHDELGEEIGRSARQWLEANRGVEPPAPPRLILMLARNAGERFGKEGFGWVMTCLQDALSVQEKEDLQYQRPLNVTLEWQLKAAVFGGWLNKEPVPAIEDYLSEWNEFENYGFAGYQDSLFEFFRRSLVGEVLEDLAGADQEKGFQLLHDFHRKLPVTCIEATTSFLQGVPEKDREVWMDRVAQAWPHLEGVSKIPFVPLTEVKQILNNHPQIDWWEVDEFLEKLNSRDLTHLAFDSKVSQAHRAGIIIELVRQGKLPPDEVLDSSPYIQTIVMRELIRGYEWDSVGPVMGREVPYPQDRQERIARLEKVIPLSSLNRFEQAELLENLKVWKGDRKTSGE